MVAAQEPIDVSELAKMDVLEEKKEKKKIIKHKYMAQIMHIQNRFAFTLSLSLL